MGRPLRRARGAPLAGLVSSFARVSAPNFQGPAFRAGTRLLRNSKHRCRRTYTTYRASNADEFLVTTLLPRTHRAI